MKKRHRILPNILLITAPLLCIFITFFVGRYSIDPQTVLKTLLYKFGLISGNGLTNEDIAVVWQLRLPRAVLGAAVGASLAASGAAFQGVFRNPLVNAGILGVSNGAGFGAALAILLFSSAAYTYSFAFIFGALAVFLSYMIGRIYNTTPTVMLILGGVIVSAFFSALISITKYVADPYNQLPAIVFWLMGSLASVGQKQFFALIPMGIGLMIIYSVRWRINVLSMGDKEAIALGVNVSRNKLLIITGATMATAGAVCVSGVIGWVGLVIPHIGRMLVGNDNRLLVPVSISLGACFLVLMDMIARNLTGSEIPLGILTSLVGAPFFVYLLKKTKGGGW